MPRLTTGKLTIHYDCMGGKNERKDYSMNTLFLILTFKLLFIILNILKSFYQFYYQYFTQSYKASILKVPGQNGLMIIEHGSRDYAVVTIRATVGLRKRFLVYLEAS